MPKNTSRRILRRWIALDAELGGSGALEIASFAQTWKVSTKTVRRDLKAFALLGRKAISDRVDHWTYYWSYEPGVELLFAENLAVHRWRTNITSRRLRLEREEVIRRPEQERLKRMERLREETNKTESGPTIKPERKQPTKPEHGGPRGLKPMTQQEIDANVRKMKEAVGKRKPSPDKMASRSI